MKKIYAHSVPCLHDNDRFSYYFVLLYVFKYFTNILTMKVVVIFYLLLAKTPTLDFYYVSK